MRRINNGKLKSFLAENNCFPFFENNEGDAYYSETAFFASLLERYYIQFVCIPNRK